MTIALRKSATYADLEALPETVVVEILFGSLVAHPRPNRRHGGAGSARGMLTGPPHQFGFGGPGGWIFVDEPTFADSDDVSAPPFDAITFSLGLLWPFDPPQPETPLDEQR